MGRSAGVPLHDPFVPLCSFPDATSEGESRVGQLADDG